MKNISSRRALARGLLVGATLLGGARVTRAFDALDVYDFFDTARARLHGYRRETIDFEWKGAPCSISLSHHVSPRPLHPVTLLMHGLGDSQGAWRTYIARRREEGGVYENFVTLDLPLHGHTECAQAASRPEDVREVIVKALAIAREREWIPALPTTTVAASLGVGVSVYLRDAYPNMNFVWVTPPVLRQPDLDQLVAFVSSIHSTEAAREFIRRIDPSRPKPPPVFAVNAILRRIERALPLVRAMPLDEIRRRLVATAPEHVRIYTGSRDRLCPPAALDESFATRFRAQIRQVDCAHTFVRQCMQHVAL